jgi:hypothetical protein
MASAVESSHFPLGAPLSAPFLASASCISVMRSGVGAICPRCRLFAAFRPERLPDFLPLDFAVLGDFLATAELFTAVLELTTDVGLPEFLALEFLAAELWAADLVLAEGPGFAEFFAPDVFVPEVFLCVVPVGAVEETAFTLTASVTANRTANLARLGVFMVFAIPGSNGTEESTRIVREIPRPRHSFTFGFPQEQPPAETPSACGRHPLCE